ncbi:MAG TPA: MBL fold metallo-hydrolase, partial [Gemmatimonadales bacterium]|nr:MBL fold metallo-hydrolase [Gemmatimonadales bacterium]
QFLGAAGTVTGSMHLVSANGRRVLLDCGLFQGLKELRLRNWREPPFDPKTIDAVVISHAHIDHTGSLPLLVRRGYRGPIFCTPATADLLGVLLPDSAHLQEEEAERANRYGYTKHKPALPLYTAADAERALGQLERTGYDRPFPVAGDVSVTYRTAGHILGAATVDLRLGSGQRLVFSGDLGRYDRPILPDPAPVPAADVLLLESTYGDRQHPTGTADELAKVVNETAERGGALLVPAFVVDRTQEVLWLLQHLEEERRIPVLPVFVDSPSATEVTEIYHRHVEEQDGEMRSRTQAGKDPLKPGRIQFCRSVEESKKLNDVRGPVIIVSASGMATGGRILHHLQHRLPDPRTTVLLVGFQAEGTRGRALQDGARTLKMFGEQVPVRARVETVHGLSAHADQAELLRWLGGFTRAPRTTYLVHGEPEATRAMAQAITTRYGWAVRIPKDGEQVSLT